MMSWLTAFAPVSRPVILDGCAFRHVVLKGQLGSFLVNRNIQHDDAARSAAFVQANEEFSRLIGHWTSPKRRQRASRFEARFPPT